MVAANGAQQQSSSRFETLSNCSSLLSFPANGLPTTLTSLRIEQCRTLEFLSREMMAKLTSLQYLYLNESCDSLRSFPLGIFPKLSSLEICWLSESGIPICIC